MSSRIKALRLAHGWTTVELARRVGVEASTIARIESGQTRLALAEAETVIALAKVFGMTLDDLVEHMKEG